MSSGEFAASVAVKGIVGGTLQDLQGGKFGHGFAAAGVSEILSPAIDVIPGSATRILASAVVGGTVSKIAGGSFANGAVTAGFMRAFNAEAHRLENGDTQITRDDGTLETRSGGSLS